jgi:hypothetical protein
MKLSQIALSMAVALGLLGGIVGCTKPSGEKSDKGSPSTPAAGAPANTPESKQQIVVEPGGTRA